MQPQMQNMKWYQEMMKITLWFKKQYYLKYKIKMQFKVIKIEINLDF